MYRDYGKVYKVFIEFNKDLISTEEEIKTFLKENSEGEVLCDELSDKTTHVNQVKILSLKGNRLELLWEVPDNEGVHEIEISLYYILEDSKYGTYTWEYVE